VLSLPKEHCAPGAEVPVGLQVVVQPRVGVEALIVEIIRLSLLSQCIVRTPKLLPNKNQCASANEVAAADLQRALIVVKHLQNAARHGTDL
jgi:hypothetical protein